MVNRVDALTLVEPQVAEIAILEYLDVIVSRFGLIDLTASLFDRAAAPQNSQENQDEDHPTQFEAGAPTSGFPQTEESYQEQEPAKNQESEGRPN